MKKRRFSATLILLIAIIFSLFCNITQAKTQCNIVWWGEESGYVPTNETSITEVATSEAFYAIYGHEPTNCFYAVPDQLYVCDGQNQNESVISGFDELWRGDIDIGNWDVICADCGAIEDSDVDGICNNVDNCPTIINPVQEDIDNDGTGDACDDCIDIDADEICDDVDNCPTISNPVQEDADSDGTGDACDEDTIYGTISGDVQEGVSIDISLYTCGVGELITTIITNAEGYYAFGGLENDTYGIYPQHSNYIFSRPAIVLQIPQTEIQSYDFTATNLICDDVDRFLDNGDGTVYDCRTGLIWLKDANCYGLQNWDNAMSSAAGLNDGECGLTDGSVEGDWHLASKEELQGIGTDPPTTWYNGYPTVIWIKAYAHLDNEWGDTLYWSSSEFSISGKAWGLHMLSGATINTSKDDNDFYIWPVRDAN